MKTLQAVEFHSQIDDAKTASQFAELLTAQDKDYTAWHRYHTLETLQKLLKEAQQWN
jgi:hypothetical protein